MRLKSNAIRRPSLTRYRPQGISKYLMPRTLPRSFREVLKQEFQRRKNNNRRYSLRAYAKFLGISPAHLSEVLNGKMGLSVRLAAQIAERLQLNEELTAYFCDSVEYLHGASRLVREEAKTRLHRRKHFFEEMNLGTLEVIGKWYHFALLELIRIKDFRFSVEAASHLLGVDVVHVQSALERLQKLGFLEPNAGGWTNRKPLASSPESIPSEVVRRYHKDMMKMAFDALDAQPVDERIAMSTVLGIERSRIPEVQKALQEFAHQLCRDFGASPRPDSVYGLSMQFFSLTKEKITP